jgi:hypothetical protein
MKLILNKIKKLLKIKSKKQYIKINNFLEIDKDFQKLLKL